MTTKASWNKGGCKEKRETSVLPCYLEHISSTGLVVVNAGFSMHGFSYVHIQGDVGEHHFSVMRGPGASATRQGTWQTSWLEPSSSGRSGAAGA